MATLSEKIVLPPKYYLDYFLYLINFVEKKYDHILITQEKDFILKFKSLSENEKCLYIRMLNRTGSFFRVEKLKYEEIGEIKPLMELLINQQFVNKLSYDWETFLIELLSIFSKKELVDFLKLSNISTKGLSSLTKDDVLHYLQTALNTEQILDLVAEVEPIVKLNFEAEVMMIKFLFFGNRHDTMTEFVTRDLGFQKYQEYDEEKLVGHFSTREEAEDRLRISIVGEQVNGLMQSHEPEAVYEIFVNWIELNETSLTDQSGRVLDRLKLKVAAFLERKKCLKEAFEMYCLTDLPPSRERRVRLFVKFEQYEEATILCETILIDPYNADERFFAIDQLEKLKNRNSKKKIKKSVTQHLHYSESILIAFDWKNRVEAGVIDYYQQNGEMACFSENFLWKAVFGLLFWDIVFDTDSLAIHHPLQRAPSDIYKPAFFENRRSKLIERLEIVESKPEFLGFMNAQYFAKQGLTNPFVDWAAINIQPLMKLCEVLTADQLKKVMLEMAINIKENTHGFPDLFTWNENSYCLVEVKSPTDSLSNQQLHWLHFFERIGIKAKVLRVEWSQTNTQKLFD